MLPKQHLFLGIIFALILLFIFPQIGWIGFVLIVFSTVLIDVDHYVFYIYKKRNLSLRKAYKWYLKKQKRLLSLSREQRNKIYLEFHFLHGIEPLLILFILGIYLSKYFFYILIGYASHLFLDIIYQRKIYDRLDRISLIYDFFKCKKLKFTEQHTIQ